MKHGITGYTYRCRCDVCRSAMNQYRTERRRAQGILPKPPSRHGTSSKYVHGCRCDECREAHTAYCRRWREEKRANNDRSQDNNT